MCELRSFQGVSVTINVTDCLGTNTQPSFSEVLWAMCR